MSSGNIAVTSPIEVDSLLQIRGTWALRSDYSFSLHVATDASATRYFLFDRVAKLAYVNSVESTALPLQKAGLLVLKDEEVFNITVHFRWQRWDVYVNTVRLFIIQTGVDTGDVSDLGLENLECITAMSIQRPAESHCVQDNHFGFILEQQTQSSSRACCEACSSENLCDSCSFTDGSCFLLTGQQPENTATSQTQQAHSSLRIMSRSGCECQPTAFALAAVTCYKSDSNSPFKCATDPSKTCLDGSTGRTSDFCNVAEITLVKQPSTPSTAMDSFDIILIGPDQIPVKRAHLSGEILSESVSKVVFVLENDTPVEIIQLNADKSSILEIYEVRMQMNDETMAVFSPPLPGSVYFGGISDSQSSAIISLSFVRLSTYFDATELNGCVFNLVDHCGYHVDLDKSSGIFFLAKNGTEPIVTAKVEGLQYFRRLSQVDVSVAPRLMQSIPALVNKNTKYSASGVGIREIELFAEHFTVPMNGAIHVLIHDVLMLTESEWGVTSKTAGLLEVLSIETKWKSVDPWEYAQIDDTSSMAGVVGDNVVTRWRLVKNDAAINIFPKSYATGDSDIKLTIEVGVKGGKFKYSKHLTTVVRDSYAQILESGLATDETEIAVSETRQLSTVDAAVSTIPEENLLPLYVDLHEGSPLSLLFSELLHSITEGSTKTCKTSITTFSLAPVVESLKTSSVATMDVSSNLNPTIVHSCGETLLIKLKTGATNVILQLRVQVSQGNGLIAQANIPVALSMTSDLSYKISKRILLGSHNKPAEESMVLTLNPSEVPLIGRVEIFIMNCSSLNIAISGNTRSTDEECSYVLQDTTNISSVEAYSGIAFSLLRKIATSLSVQVKIIQRENGGTYVPWVESQTMLQEFELHFCDMEIIEPTPHILQVDTDSTYVLATFPSDVLGISLNEFYAVTSVSFIWETKSIFNSTSLLVDGSPASSQAYNSTANFSVVDAVAFSKFTYTPPKIGFFAVDIFVEWKNVLNSGSGCIFVPNLHVSVLPSFLPPLVATPYIFSRQIIAGTAARISLPILQTSNPGYEETMLLELSTIAVDATVTVERNGNTYSASTTDQRHYAIIGANESVKSERHITVIVAPAREFTGILHLSMSVTAIGKLFGVLPIEDVTSEAFTRHDFAIEWIPTVQVSRTSTKSAVYRSLPTKITGPSTLSFGYRMESEFSIIKAEVLLNSTETQHLWSSEAVVFSQSAWKDAKALIDVAYPSTAEIIFRGLTSAQDMLSLKAISMRDNSQTSVVGVVDFIGSTGGMIYISVNTSIDIPVPVLFRAYTKEVGVDDQPQLGYIGDSLQYLGCEAIRNMYSCGQLSSTSMNTPLECLKLCTATETQIRFTSNSTVRSSQMMYLPINDNITFEMWVYLDNSGSSFTEEQLLLVYGTSEKSMAITMNSYIMISRCNNQLRIPRGIPFERWTHVSIVFSGDNAVKVLFNGYTVADAQLGKCTLPTLAYLQLGRDTLGVQPQSVALGGAIDEIRIWKVARQATDIYASFRKNIQHPDLILFVSFNSAENTNWFPSGKDWSGNNADFIVRQVDAMNSRLASAFGVTGDRSCYYASAAALSDTLPTSMCDMLCDDGDLRSCGSDSNNRIASVYGRGSFGIGGLSALTTYEISVEFVIQDGGEFTISKSLDASTTHFTTPEKIKYVRVVKRLGQQVEIQWRPVDDNGGTEIISYLVFLNGFQVADTRTGIFLSTTFRVPYTNTTYLVSVRALNSVGLGPHSDPIILDGIYNATSPETPPRPTISFVSGGTVGLVLDETTNLAISRLAYTVILEQRESSYSDFTGSFFRKESRLITVYKLRHNTLYAFRLSVISQSGLRSKFSPLIAVTTGQRLRPAKTPTPQVSAATGGSIVLKLEEPLDTGGMPIGTFSLYMLQDGVYSKLATVSASGPSGETSIIVTHDLTKKPLLPLTPYTFKVLALQLDATCDSLTDDDGLESEAVVGTTTPATIPPPPPKPILLQQSGCTLSVTAALPDDLGGTTVNMFIVQVFSLTGVSLQNITAPVNSASVQNLLANTTYLLRASLVTSVGNTPFGDVLAVTTGQPGLPGKLTTFSLSEINTSSVYLQWERPQDSGGGAIAGYLVYQSLVGANTTPKLIYNGSQDAQTKSFRVTRLLASSSYLFSVVVLNQYGMSSDTGDNILYITTLAPVLPYPPLNVRLSGVGGGYMVLSYADPIESGGFDVTSLQYIGRLSFLTSCYSVTGCSTCSHLIGSGQQFTAVAGTSSSCIVSTCSGGKTCCLSNGVKCGVLVTKTQQCSRVSAGQCHMDGLNSSTLYISALAAQNAMGLGPFSDSVAVTTSEARASQPPVLKLIAASGGSITLEWNLPSDTGGVPIVRMSLSVNGNSLFDTTSSFSYTHCGGLHPNTDYTYTIEIENEGGYISRTTATFTTAQESQPGDITIYEPLVGVRSVQLSVAPPCDNGGASDILTVSYRVYAPTTTTPEVLVSCCVINIADLEPATNYSVEVRAQSSNFPGEWKNVSFTTMSGVPSIPNTTFLYANSSALKLALIPPLSSQSDSLSIEVTANPVNASNQSVHHVTLLCSKSGSIMQCPTTLVIPALNTTLYGYSFSVGVRAIGVMGSSGWANHSYDLDNGVLGGSLGFVESVYRGLEGTNVSAKIARVYGTTTQEVASFKIESPSGNLSWSCAVSGNGNDSICSITNQSTSVGTITFGMGEYEKTITLTFDDLKYEDPPAFFSILLLNTTNSTLNITTCKLYFDDNGDAGILAFTASQLTVSETVGSFSLTIARLGGNSGTVNATLSSTLSSALVNNIFTTRVTFGEGISRLTIPVAVRRSFEYGSRKFGLTLSNPSDGASIDTGNMTVIVQDAGDISIPGIARASRGLVTGGCIELVLTQPTFAGGQAISCQYIIVFFVPGGNFLRKNRSSANSINVCGLTNDTTYAVSVYAVNDRGVGDMWNTSFTTGPISAPTAIIGFGATVTAGCAKLSWTAPIDSGGMTIVLYQVTIQNMASSEVRSQNTSGSNLTMSICCLTEATSYTFSIQATSGANLTSPVTELSADTSSATSPQQPPPPELIEASGGALHLWLIAPKDCGGSPIAHYNVYYARNTGATTQYAVQSGTIATPSYADRVANVSIYGLLFNSMYFVTVQLSNEMGFWSPQSVIANYSTTGPTSIKGIPTPRVSVEDPGELTLSWDAPLDSGGLSIVGYLVYSRYQLQNGTWTISTIAYDGRTSVSQTALIANVRSNTNYAFSVLAYNFRMFCRPDEYISPSDELLLTTQDASVPFPPKNVRSINITGGSVVLAWDPPKSNGEPLLWYLVKGGIAGASNHLILANISANGSTSVTLYKLIAETVYEFAVAGGNAKGIGSDSTIYQVSTSPVSSPSAPINLHQVMVVSGGTVSLAWEPPDDFGGSDVRTYWVFRNNKLVGAAYNAQTSFNDQLNVQASHSYNYMVYAANGFLNGTIGASIFAISSNASLPAAPLVPVVQPHGGSVDITITPSPDSGGTPLIGFQATVLQNMTSLYTFNQSGPQLSFSGLFANTQYQLIIQTISSFGLSPSITVNVCTTPPTLPGKMVAPRSIEYFGGRIRFLVSPPADFGGSKITWYSFYLDGSKTSAIAVAIDEYDIAGLTALTSYAISVSAVNKIGEGEPGDPIIVTTTQVNPPGVIDTLIVDLTGLDVIVVKWRMPIDTGGDDGALAFDLQIGSIGIIAEVSENVSSPFTIYNLVPATNYSIRVRAKNAAGPGEWSAALEAKTDPLSPGVIEFVQNKTTVSEANMTVNIDLIRINGANMPAACMYYTSDGTAVAGTHYVASSGIIEFTPTMYSQRISIGIINNDIIDDPDRYFYVYLDPRDDSSGEIGTIGNATVIIADDGDAGVIAFGQVNYSVLESSTTLAVSAVRKHAFSGNIIVAVDTIDTLGGAVKDRDYSLTGNTVTFLNQQRTATIVMAITNDVVYRPNNVFGLKLRIVQGRSSVVDPTNTIVEILDDGDISRPGVPTNVQITPVSGGVFNASWVSPDNWGAKNVSTFLYSIRVVTSDNTLVQEISTDALNVSVARVQARTVYEVSVAAVSNYLSGSYTTQFSAEMGNPTPPSAPQTVALVSRTGGSATISWSPPFDFGGSTISSYRISLSTNNSALGTYSSAACTFSFYGLVPLRTYMVTLQAISGDGLVGGTSFPALFDTRNISAPGKPTQLDISKSTGGGLWVSMAPPLDIGGAPILNFSLYMTSAQYPNVFREVYTGANGSYTVLKLTFSTAYQLQYKVYNSAGPSGLSDIFIAKTSYLSLPDEPQNLQVVSQTGGSITMSWNQPLDLGGSDITVYEATYFDLRDPTTFRQQRITGVRPNEPVIYGKIVGLLANSTYGLIVSGINDVSVCKNASSLGFKTVFGRTAAPVTLPDIPSNLSVVNCTSGQQTIQWSPSEDTGGGSSPVSYVLYSESNTVLYNGTKTAFTRGSLMRNTLYTYSVYAWNQVGTSAQSLNISVRTNAALALPSKPIQLIQTNSTGGSIGLSWQPPQDTGGDVLTSYIIHRGSDFVDTISAGGNTVSYIDDHGLLAQQVYVYTVQSNNSLGASVPGETVTATTNQSSYPLMPINLRVKANGGNLTAQWSAPGDTGGIPLTYYQLQVLLGGSRLFAVNVSSTTLSYTIYGVRTNASYTLAVKASNKVGESPFATQVVINGAAVRPGPPQAPENISFLSWMLVLKLYLPIDDGGFNISQLLVYQDGAKVLTRTVDMSVQALVGDPTNRSIQTEVGPLRGSTTYNFSISAVSIISLGESARSPVLQVTTDPIRIPTVPLNLNVTERRAYSIFLNWDTPFDAGGDDLQYEISYFNNNDTIAAGVETSTVTTSKSAEVTSLRPGKYYSFRLRAKNAAGVSAWTGYVNATTLITDRGVIVFQVSTPVVFENITSVNVMLIRVNGSSGTITGSYAPSSTASPGETLAIEPRDFSLPSDRTFVFLEEQMTNQFVVQIIDNTIYDPNPRTLRLILTDASNLFPSTSTTITILDDGDAGKIGFEKSEVTVLENARYLNLGLQRLGGLSSDVKVRVVVYNGTASTTQVDAGFRLPTTPIDFFDGVVAGSTSIVIKDNDVYDFPFLYFYLTLEISAGGAQIGTNSILRVLVLDDGDRSVPGPMASPGLSYATGGMLVLSWDPPINVGGQALWITNYNISYSVNTTTKAVVTAANTTTQPIGNLSVLTRYNISIAAINAVGRGNYSANVSLTTTNYTTPGPTQQILQINSTGGLITLNVTSPLDMGGASIAGVILYLVSADGSPQVVYNGTGNPSTILSVSVQKPKTLYQIRAQVISSISSVGVGNMSDVFNVSSGALSRPGPPRLPSSFASRTGGAIKLFMGSPIDTGGHEDLSFAFYYREVGLNLRYRKALYNAQGMEVTIFRLAAQTTYEIISISLLPADVNKLASSTIYLSNSSIVLADGVSSNTVKASGYFDFGAYLFEVDSSQPSTSDVIPYLVSWKTDVGAVASMNLSTEDEYEVFVRGRYSEAVNYTTDAPSRPGIAPQPTLMRATGGALHVRLLAPNDTGGIEISDYELYINNEMVDGVFYEYLSEGNFDLQVTAEIGGLSPKTAYNFYYIPVNDASACPGDDEPLPKSEPFSTKNASLPNQIQSIWEAGSTGGGIHVEWDPPNDRGSDFKLYYQVYKSSLLPKPRWSLVFNGTESSYWQTGLATETAYIFMASCVNEVGYSTNSSEFTLRTTLVSAPGPPSNLTKLDTTGGMIHFSWSSPQDNGGSPVTHYVVHGVDSERDIDLTVDVKTTEVYFGGLLAERDYEFSVYAGNNLGTGTDPGQAVFATTKATTPSVPDTIVVQSVSGGSATLAIQVPRDTGGIRVDDLTCTVFANGIKIPPESVRRVSNYIPAVAASAPARRLASGSVSRKLVESTESFIYVQAGGLMPSVTYSFSTKVSNGAKASGVTISADGTTSEPTKPGAPDPPIQSSITGGALTLSWSDPIDTGGVPLTSYRLSLKRFGDEVGSCEGLILSCTVGNLPATTDYTATVVAFNLVGASVPSASAEFTTNLVSVPMEPQNPNMVRVSDIDAVIQWDPCIDFGGADVSTYLVEVVQASDSSIKVPSTSVPTSQRTATISGLVSLTDYIAHVRAVTVDGILGEASTDVYFTTTRVPNQSPAPSLGCFSLTSLNIYWDPVEGARGYLLYRNDELLQDNGEDTTAEDTTITLGMTYYYQLVVEMATGVQMLPSEKVKFVATTPLSSGFNCKGDEGYINVYNYPASLHQTWTIKPENGAGLAINITFFWLECNHDSLLIEVTALGVKKTLWSGGCHRRGDFIVVTNPNIESVVITFTSDASVTYSGFKLYYEAVDSASVAESVNVPCPVSPSGLCSLNGACRKGSCLCFSGFTGESCSNAVICPKSTSTCSNSTCDPICLVQSNVIAVTADGDDTQGTGQLMDTSSTGTDSKAVQTLRRALYLAKETQTILLYPGVYSGAGFCGIGVTTKGITIRGLKGSDETVIDCQGKTNGLSIAGVTVNLMGLTFNNSISTTNGGSINADNAVVTMEDVCITNSNAGQFGGSVYASRSNISLINTLLDKGMAGAKGGAVYMEDRSSLALSQSTVQHSVASEGGGIYARNSIMLSGDARSKIWYNNATTVGGGIYASDTAKGYMLNVTQNKAPLGAGVAITAGTCTLEKTSIFNNVAKRDGGGVAIMNTAYVNLTNSQITKNTAGRNGGCIYIEANGTVTSDVGSIVSNCSADSGGGVYVNEWSQITLSGIVILNSTATESGGCAAFSGCSATVANSSLKSCVSLIGGGVYAVRSSVTVQNVVITGNVATNGSGVYVNSSSIQGENERTLSQIKNNIASQAGGGFFVTGPSSSINQLTIQNCSAPSGGGIFAMTATTGRLFSISIQGNMAAENGGGMLTRSSALNMTDVDIFQNNAGAAGGGLFASDSVITGSVTVYDNWGQQGGGIATKGSNVLKGVFVKLNRAEKYGGGLSDSYGTLILRNVSIESCWVDSGFGGGIHLLGTNAQHQYLTIQNCSSLRGGGIYANASLLRYAREENASVVVMAQLNNTRAQEYGGGIFIAGNATGISDVTIINGTASYGGGIAALAAMSCDILNIIVLNSTVIQSGGGGNVWSRCKVCFK